MKFSILLIAAAVLYVSAGPAMETPSVRGGTSQQCKDSFAATLLNLPFVTTNGKNKLLGCAASQALQVSKWFKFTTPQLQLNIDSGSVCANAISVSLYALNPAIQIQLIIQYFANVQVTMQASVSAVLSVDVTKGKAMQAQLVTIQASIQACQSALQAAAATSTIYQTFMLIVSDTVVYQIQSTVTTIAQFQNDCACAYSDANNANNMNALLMDIMYASLASAKHAASLVVQAAVSAAVQVNVVACQAVLAVQVTAMQASPGAAQITMGIVSDASAVQLTALVGIMQMQTVVASTDIVSIAANLTITNAACTSDMVQNMTDASGNFTQMCSNTTDSDDVTAAANNATVNITIIMESSSSISVQMCATIAIAAILVEQTKGHNGIGQCVSDGKKEFDNDMQDMQNNYTASCNENNKNLTDCATKYSDPNTNINDPNDTNSGANRSQKLHSCDKKHVDQDHKKSRGNSDDKCKRHKPGGDNHEKVKQCKHDAKTQCVTNIVAIYAQFTVCVSAGGP